MATSLLECEVCAETFDSENRKPICLPCGHTFCYLCIHSVKDLCPSCRKRIGMVIDQLPINYTVISHNSKASSCDKNSANSGCCSLHGCALECLCIACEEIVCRKCSRDKHTGHRVEFMDDIAGSDKVVDDVTRAFHCKLQSQFNLLESLLSASSKMKAVLGEVKDLSNVVDQWNDLILGQITTLREDLEIWDNKLPIKTNVFKKMLTHSKIQLPDEPDMAQTKANFEKLYNQVAELEVLVMSNPSVSLSLNTLMNSTRESLHDAKGSPSGLLPPPQENLVLLQKAVCSGIIFPRNEEWVITSTAEAEKAILSILCGQNASAIKVVSSPAEPIGYLPQFLNDVVNACTKGISLVPLGLFWGLEDADEHLWNFVSQHRCKLQMLYGPMGFILAGLFSGPTTTLPFGHLPQIRGVSLAHMKDIELCSGLAEKPSAVCCWKLLPADAGNRLKELQWTPHEWHFPALCDDQIDWMYCIMEPAIVGQGRHYLYLPRCHLTEDGYRSVINKIWYGRDKLNILCEPHKLSLESASRIADLAQDKSIGIQWSIPLTSVL